LDGLTLDRERWIDGRYLLGECIAAGGVGAVHRGRTREGAEIAIKRLRPDAAHDARLDQSLLDDASVSSKIRHPNVVHVIEAVVEQGETFVVMELVTGHSLAEILKSARLPLRISTGILAQVLLGLHAAHEHDVVHRDVSPQNILVGNDGNVKVTDFGIAQATQRAQYTRTGEVKGKLGYLSFEQVNQMKLDRRTDVFSASVVFWEMLTARRLFDGATEAEVMEQVLSKTPEPPSRVEPGVPKEIDAIVVRGLSRRARDRFDTALEMQRALLDSGQVADDAEIAAWLAALRPSAVGRPAKRPALWIVVPASLLVIVLLALLFARHSAP
jgi:serine/threonine-protein kinase